MLIELKRCNSIGNIDGLLFLISIIFGKSKVSRFEINNRCAMESGITINCSGASAFLEYINLVKVTEKYVIPTDSINKVVEKGQDEIINEVIKLCLNKLIEEGVFAQDTLLFDLEKGHLSIKRSAFPLAYAAVRNFLTIAGVFEKEKNGKIGVTDYCEFFFVKYFKEHRKKFTIEQLLKRQEEQSKMGLEAEEFILGLERSRLPEKAHKIKRISDFDVAAGYDIVSYEAVDSDKYDRFIEVKCYCGKTHFYWSDNECDVAKKKGDKYILCLVDYNRISEPGYQPHYIKNPYNIVFSDDNWLVSTASYKVQKI